MWIRDELPRHLPGSRAVIYGYDTKLDDSQSFQSIPDLAKHLINSLEAHGWDLPSAKPIAFLAHSLGGLVLKQALVQLADTTNPMYTRLLGTMRGMVSFGVPNLGMQQHHFRAIVKNNANSLLIEDIARNSNYLRELHKDFSEGSFNKHLTCFWAFETAESPTVIVCEPDIRAPSSLHCINRRRGTGMERSVAMDLQPF
jgi:hypothetical protein